MTLSKPILLLRVMFALVGAAGCAGCGNAIDVHTNTAPAADFSRYQTFGFGPPEAVSAHYGEAQRTDEAQLRTQALVSEILQSKGYRPAAPPDLVVRLAAGIRRKAMPFPLAAPAPGSSPADPWFRENEADEILEGALVVDVYDRASGALLWHGAARAFIDPDHFDEERLRRGVAAIMNSFPARR